jgi:hypothetical protein
MSIEAALAAPNGGFMRAGADGTLVTECHPVIGRTALGSMPITRA